MNEQPARTLIYKRTETGDEIGLGYLDAQGRLWRAGGNVEVGRVTGDGRVLRKTAYDERELGVFTAEGEVHSHGLFEGGALGWVDADGVVNQGGLIFGEEEVGRVAGPQQPAAAAALLLLFLPDDAEESRRFR
ncbi:hypothetical protein [Caldilinea sp.]|uniref:hypothetical protein n=1 Tax=Caldilinea sp. TaxID=2293560 RepID=UPI002CE4F53E|nr:hypothetical protein [Caldilinea sp.]HRA67284.1 hypothetical protein [Caldilinea sp.]